MILIYLLFLLLCYKMSDNPFISSVQVFALALLVLGSLLSFVSSKTRLHPSLC